MQIRQIVLDTETTGLKVEEKHRIIEIAAVELINRKLTGKYFHLYINPQREVDPGALAVHGLRNEFLQDKPLFAQIVDEFLAFVANSELIIHNAPFDLSFINYELSLLPKKTPAPTLDLAIVDTLQLARRLHPGQRNNLDALCKRYGVDNSKREWHGALLDANLLAQVYLAMTGGQSNFFDQYLEETQSDIAGGAKRKRKRKHFADIVLPVIKASVEESNAHDAYLKKLPDVHYSWWELLDDT